MTMRRALTMLTFAAAAALATPAGAVNLLSDGFEGETFGLARTSLANFTVNSGNVDVVGPSFFGIACSGGSRCLDLDGSSTGGPTRLSTASYAFAAGDTVRFALDLSGNQRGGADDDYQLGFQFGGNVLLSNRGYNFFGSDVNFGGSSISGFGVSTGISSGDPFARRSVFFTALQAGSVTFSLSTLSADDFGPIVDNVSIDLTNAGVPEPATWAMMIGGMGVAGGALRRRAKRAIAA